MLAENVSGKAPALLRREHLYVGRSHWSYSAGLHGLVSHVMLWNATVDWSAVPWPELDAVSHVGEPQGL
eukprot:CAMPEP_0183474822 /NCGR_PEP_ID=MMETSP0370-20130417/163750_1 /TAXON_ID=268820 /ORGANISM="Peridinium aciculiferum, Strain PAER-2" /LENGTH=68 /DNA_ID=CAMNT_0025667577 /DNA_START=127 /DNA_END=330 /DNA_ORIENTATION=+